MSSDTPLPLNLSSSLDLDPGGPKTDDPYFEKMAAQGQSSFKRTAKGEFPLAGGFWVCHRRRRHGLTTKGRAGPWKSEVVWPGGGGGYYPPDDILFLLAAASRRDHCGQRGVHGLS